MKSLGFAEGAQAAADINAPPECLVKGSKVWVKSEDTWLAGELKSDGPSANMLSSTASPSPPLMVQMADGGKVLSVEVSNLAPANPKLQEGIPDLTHLSFLNEPGILFNLQHRYGGDGIYTFAGPVLIALNPCKTLPLYSKEVANSYKAAARDTLHSLDPHIYLVAANAFRQMLREGSDQSLIVNGESGAGKTETTKKAMQYFATLAGGTGVEDQVLETNPVLEAFGNAKTLRNHNSSRFGKLIQIHFNQSHRICGACIKTYLLEKSRVVHQLQGERSFHIFYQLVRGCSPLEQGEWKLLDKPEKFRYLSQSGCSTITGLDDAEEFSVVRRAMSDIGLSPELQSHLFRSLSGILWLGNVTLHSNSANDSTVVENNEALDNVCHLLGLDKLKLCSALTERKIVTPSEIVTRLLKEDEAKEARDALAKATYAAIFNWVVAQINAKLNVQNHHLKSPTKSPSNLSTGGHCISILDIYGFEQFAKNSFEQLCINYANERLQQQFTRHLFTLEQSEYESEGIDWTKIEFVDNQESVDLIEMQPPKGLGLLSVLDDQSRFPKATDEQFCLKLKESLSTHSKFGAPPRSPNDFVVMHYAGPVQYTSVSPLVIASRLAISLTIQTSKSGFLDKNKDTLSSDLLEVMSSSSSYLLPLLAASVKEDWGSKGGGGGKGQTVGSRFGVQLRELIADLDATGLHFVRCIKPNAQLQPNSFDSPMTLHQLRCCGVLEVARIARAGFPTRYTHDQFADRYKILLPAEDQQAITIEGQGARNACLRLLNTFGLQPGSYQLGKTKVFFRAGVLGFVEDRWTKIQESALKIQTAYRMHQHRSKFVALRRASLVLQTTWRARVDRVAYNELRSRLAGALEIQRAWRSRRERTRYRKMKEAALFIQMAYRRHCFKRGVRQREYQTRLRERALRAEQESFVALRNEFGVDISQVREALELRAVCKSKGISTPAELTATLVNASRVNDAQTQALTAQLATSALALAELKERLAVSESKLSESRASESEAKGRTAAAEEELQESKKAAGTRTGAWLAGVAATGAVLSSSDSPASPAVDRLSVKGPTANPSSHALVVQELHVELERVKLEKGKLAKELQGQKMIKERDSIRASEAQAKMLGMIRGLQDYVQMVKGDYAKHHLQLPPLPLPLLAPPPAAVTPSDAPQVDQETAGAKSRGGGVTEIDANQYVLHSEPEEDSKWRSRDDSKGGSTLEAVVATALLTPSQQQQPHTLLHQPRELPPAIVTSPSPSSSTPALTPPAPQPAAQSSSQKYVGGLKTELDKVSQVLTDDVNFIVEVKNRTAEAEGMDPNFELLKLRKKFEIWKREFKDKLATTESVLKKLNGPGRQTRRFGF